jgi:Spx/MgsR family transcriptional regulator
LREAGVEHEFRDPEKEPLTEAELKALIGKRSVDDFVNPRSTPYRKLGLAGKTLTDAAKRKLLLEEPNLMKRPLLVDGARIVFGFDREAYAEIARTRGGPAKGR